MELRPAGLDVLEQLQEKAQVEVGHQPRLHADLGGAAPDGVIDFDENGVAVVPVGPLVAGVAAEAAEEAAAHA